MAVSGPGKLKSQVGVIDLHGRGAVKLDLRVSMCTNPITPPPKAETETVPHDPVTYVATLKLTRIPSPIRQHQAPAAVYTTLCTLRCAYLETTFPQHRLSERHVRSEARQHGNASHITQLQVPAHNESNLNDLTSPGTAAG